MTVRVDHVAGGLFVAGGLAIFALSGELPFGTLAFPGAGFMPKTIAALLILMGGLLAAGAGATTRLRDLDWSDFRHAAAVAAVTAAAVAFYTVLGFVIVVPLMLFALLVAVERKKVVPAALYSAGLTACAYLLFHALRAQLPGGPFGF